VEKKKKKASRKPAGGALNYKFIAERKKNGKTKYFAGHPGMEGTSRKALETRGGINARGRGAFLKEEETKRRPKESGILTAPRYVSGGA